MATQAFESNTQETEAGGSLQPVCFKERVPGQPRLQKENKKPKNSFRIIGFRSQAIPVAFRPTELLVLTEHTFFL